MRALRRCTVTRRIMCEIVYFLAGLMWIIVMVSPCLFLIVYDGLSSIEAVYAFLAYILVFIAYFVGRFYVVPGYKKFLNEIL